MNPAALYGLLASATLLGVGVGLLTRDRRRLSLAAVCAGLALVPVFGGESLAVGLHGALGAPSATLLALAVRRLLAPAAHRATKPWAAVLILCGALAFYIPALGWGTFDPYRLGYRPLPLLLALIPFGAWLAWRRHDAWLVILGFDLLAYAAGLFGNLWDALFDPLLVLLAVASLMRPRITAIAKAP